jgi:hypothetical protein
MAIILRELRFVSAQPAIDYYVWQVEVMLNNFIKNGINLNNVDIVCWKANGVIPENWQKLANSYAARFFFYDDTRETKNYISSIRPNILKQHWRARPEIWNDAILYHDCDIVFTKPIDWNQFLIDENWYGSDCRWYIGHDYIISKGEDILDAMCEIVDIPKNIIKENEHNAIGAQYLMKGITAEFWENVERDCEKLFTDITHLNNQKKALNPTYHELQIWCADMWAVLWNGWKMGYQSICHEDLEFSWGTSAEKDWFDMNIYHNAGVTDGNSGLFYKALYMDKLPYNEPLTINKNTANWHYWNEIQETAKKSVLL